MITAKARDFFKDSLYDADVYLVEDGDISLPDRSRVTNKGDAGRLLAAGGGRGMAGAVAFCAEAAYRCGVGLVELLTHSDNRIPVQILIPEATVSFWEDFQGVPKSCTSLAVGMGMGNSKDAARLVDVLMHSSVPKVIDADGLNIISRNRELLGLCNADTVLTPHVGEFSRLTDMSIADIKRDPVTAAVELVQSCGANLVLKDSTTVIVTHDLKVFINTSGDSTLSKGGSGDILAGITASLMAQGMCPSTAAYTAPFILGRTGESVGKRLGVRGALARDVIAELPYTIKEY